MFRWEKGAERKKDKFVVAKGDCYQTGSRRGDCACTSLKRVIIVPNSDNRDRRKGKRMRVKVVKSAGRDAFLNKNRQICKSE